MNPGSFGACVKLPLADCPFTRSKLTVTDAERELQMLQSRERWDIADRGVVLTDPPVLEYPRMRAAEIEAMLREVEAPEANHAPVPELSGAFWQRLAWLRKGGSY